MYTLFFYISGLCNISSILRQFPMFFLLAVHSKSCSVSKIQLSIACSGNRMCMKTLATKPNNPSFISRPYMLERELLLRVISAPHPL